VQGLAADEAKNILSSLKKKFNCNGAIVQDKELDIPVIQLSGDQRKNVSDFLVEKGYAKTNIKIHGY
jgi:translation initiation factor 1